MMEIFCDKNLNEHNWAKITVIFGNLLVYVAMLGFNALATFENPKNTLFQYSVGGISDVYFVEITPAGWVFGLIWTTIFIWNLLWMLYALANIWRRTENGNLVYRRLNFFPSGLFLVFAFNNVVIIAWLFVWAGLNLGWSLFLIILAVISVDICVLIVARRTYYMKDELRRLKHNFDVVALYITLNGLGFFATWLSLATNLNMAQFLTWVCGAEDHIAETIALINILIIALVYSICENFFWHRFLLYMFSPWVVANLALAGSISKNWNTISNRNQILLLVLIIMTALLAVAKIVFVVLYNTVLKHRLHNHKVTPQQQQSVEMKEPKKTDVDI